MEIRIKYKHKYNCKCKGVTNGDIGEPWGYEPQNHRRQSDKNDLKNFGLRKYSLITFSYNLLLI